MKKTLMFLIALTMTASCATISTATSKETATAEICKTAGTYVDSMRVALNEEQSVNKLDLDLEACGLIADTGMGYAIYHLNGYDRASGEYLGHMKRMMVYNKTETGWIVKQEGTLVFIPPPGSVIKAAPSDHGLNL